MLLALHLIISKDFFLGGREARWMLEYMNQLSGSFAFNYFD